MSFTDFYGGQPAQQSSTILAILVKGHKRNISVTLFFESSYWSRKCLKDFYFYFCFVDHLI